MKFQNKIIFVLILILNSCYSFRGALPEDLKTIYIEPVMNKESREQNYANDLNRMFIEAFVNDNSLQLVDSKSKAHIILSSSIEQIEQKTVTFDIASGRAQSNLYQLSLSVKIEFTNQLTQKSILAETLTEQRNIGANENPAERTKKLKEMLLNISTNSVDKIIGTW